MLAFFFSLLLSECEIFLHCFSVPDIPYSASSSLLMMLSTVFLNFMYWAVHFHHFQFFQNLSFLAAFLNPILIFLIQVFNWLTSFIYMAFDSTLRSLITYLFMYLFVYIIVVLCVYIVAFTKVLTMYQMYNTYIHPPLLSFIFPSLISEIVSAGIIFTFIYMCINYMHHIHPTTTFSTISALPQLSTLPHCRTCSVLLSSNFVEEKTKKIIRGT
jgi:hypothetical protein